MGEGRSTGVVDAHPSATLTEEQARAIYQQGEEAVVFALRTLSKQRAELAAKLGRQPGAKVSTPSGMTAVYEKPPTNRCGKTPGQKEGPPGVRRAAPVRIDRRQEHKLDRCRRCAKELRPEPTRTRTRIIEDIPQQNRW